MIKLFHGFSGDRTSWDDVLEHWQLDQPARSIDLPGHGGQPAVAASWADNLEALRQRLGPALETSTLVGYSLGARVALGLVAAGWAPRAVLISVNPGLSPHERAPRRKADAAWADLLRTDGLPAFAERWSAQPLFQSQLRVEPRRRSQRQAVRLAQTATGLARSLETMGLAEMPDYRPELARLASRLQLVVGADDAKFCALAEAMVAAVPELPLHRLADCGHDVPLEQPQRLAELLGRLVGSQAS